MTVDIEALRALERAATPGPWDADEDAWILASDDDRGFVAQVFDGLRPTATDETSALANAAFIAAARNAFPALADEVERLRAALEQAAESVARAAVFRRSSETENEHLRELLTRAREHIDGEIDVIDGDYGEPHPNAAMILASAIDAALGGSQ